MIESTNRDNEDQDVSKDTLLEILSHKRRRFALYCLKKYQAPMTLADLADEVARLEYDADTLLQIPAEDVKQIYLDLYHAHIPRMEEANLLEYIQEEDTVYLKYDLSNVGLQKLI